MQFSVRHLQCTGSGYTQPLQLQKSTVTSNEVPLATCKSKPSGYHANTKHSFPAEEDKPILLPNVPVALESRVHYLEASKRIGISVSWKILSFQNSLWFFFVKNILLNHPVLHSLVAY